MLGQFRRMLLAFLTLKGSSSKRKTSSFNLRVHHKTLCPSPGHEKEARTQQSATLKVCVSVCTAACRSFPLEHAYAQDVTHTRMNRKNPHYTSSFEVPYPISEHFCEKTALLNSIFNIQPLYCGIINYSHLSKV